MVKVKKKQTKTQLNPTMVEALKYLEKNKQYFGFADYKITLKDKTMEDNGKGDNEVIAQANPDPYENILEITLFKGYENRDDKKDILIHELIHARVGLFNIKLDKKLVSLRYEEEEQMVNELTRGFRKLMDK